MPDWPQPHEGITGTLRDHDDLVVFTRDSLTAALADSGFTVPEPERPAP
jgi:hypothetical protein